MYTENLLILLLFCAVHLITCFFINYVNDLIYNHIVITNMPNHKNYEYQWDDEVKILHINITNEIIITNEN